MHRGDWAVAEDLFGDALKVSNHDDRAHWGLAESLWQRGERETAVAHMEQAVRLSANDPVLLSRLGRMYADLKMVDKAHEQSRLALHADRNSAENWTLRGDCLASGGKWDEALAAYHRALAIQPDHSTALLQSAEVYRRQGRHDRMLATIDRMIDHVGADQIPARADLLRGIAMRHLGRHGEAQRSFAIAARKQPEDPTPHLQLASVAMDQGDYPAAQQALATAVKIQPDLAQDEAAMKEFQVPQFASRLEHIAPTIGHR